MIQVTIAGGGLSGAAAAIHLARAGRAVTLFERAPAPADKICGEFLSPRAQRELAGLGLDLDALGAHPITDLRLVRGPRSASLRLPFVARGLTRRRLDEALLAAAATHGADIHRGQPLAALPSGPVFLATGKHELRAHPRAQAPPDLVGFKTYLRLRAAAHATLAHHIELHLFPDGYAGLQRVEHAANLCLLVTRARLHAAGGDWPQLLASLIAANPILADRLDGARELLARPLAIARVPFGFVHRPSDADPPDLYRLGDQAAVIHAFAGDGMSLALGSARLAATMHDQGAGALAYHRALHRRLAAPVARSHALFRAGRHPAGQSAMIAAARFCPSLLRATAIATRT